MLDSGNIDGAYSKVREIYLINNHRITEIITETCVKISKEKLYGANRV